MVPFYNLWQKYWIRIILDWYVLQWHMHAGDITNSCFPHCGEFYWRTGTSFTLFSLNRQICTTTYLLLVFLLFETVPLGKQEYLAHHKSHQHNLYEWAKPDSNLQNPRIQICKTQEFKSAVKIFTAWCCQNVFYDSLWMKVTTLATRGFRILKN